MLDPRDEVANQEDLLSEDSSDEYKDLCKEFELRARAIKEKRQKQSKQLQDELVNPQCEVQASPEKKEPKPVNLEASIDSSNEAKSGFLSHATKPSQLLAKLYDANLKREQEKHASIDYDRRKFEFDFSGYEYNAKDVSNDQCSISGHYLRKRYLTKEQVEQILTETDCELKIVKTDKLLAKVHRENNYAEPLYTNWCLVGFVIQKSKVLYTKTDKKYMKLKIGNFQHSVDLILFDGAFERNWKLQQGDLILILNPIINKYEIKVDEFKFKTGFNLKLDNTNVCSILEIGAIRDFGLCQYLKKSDNQRCNNVVNTTKQKLCDIHLDMKFKQSTRMELNGCVTMRSPSKNNNKTKVYMSTGKNGVLNTTISSGHVRHFNEDSQFTSSGIGKIDTRKYQDPRILQVQAKKRKLLNERANQVLEKKLSQLSKNNNSIVDSLNLKINKHETPSVLETHFSPSMISKIGFDPTNIEMNKSAPQPKKLQELYELTCKSSQNKHLGVSTEDKKAKLKHWQKNISNLKKYDSKLKESNLSISSTMNVRGGSFIKKRKTDRTVETDDDNDDDDNNNIDDDNDDDDDDLDIMFDNDESKVKYAKILGK
ncbi:hypothetical protein KGF56_004250 [Candida oxycetoniae]|uniref:Zinc finger Mcm10/DnaG-type domain-containing protein n=1 Tax=Candida oxycetoniae TaxID=497107 RepID=A0AAI9STY0_9ASCO|nr:uncharacterized protein KGF56_004250 [Candida oxycetoniae]KAI3402997.2 hypothetical protein KGF56_004250 [Candida oxycetoniae]